MAVPWVDQNTQHGTIVMIHCAPPSYRLPFKIFTTHFKISKYQPPPQNINPLFNMSTPSSLYQHPLQYIKARSSVHPPFDYVNPRYNKRTPPEIL